MILKEMPRTLRPRERLAYYGKESLSERELMALLIGSGTREKTALDLADELLVMDPAGLKYLADCSVEELSQVDGIGTAKAAVILAGLELGRRVSKRRQKERVIIDSDSAAEFFREELSYLQAEVFKVAHLDAKGHVMGVEEVSKGDVTGTVTGPRETFRQAVKRGCYAVILGHNHPSGDPTPSRADIATTKKLVAAGEVLGIRVVDHIIIGDHAYCSLKREGYIKD